MKPFDARFNLIPFTMTIPSEERDPELSDKLPAEWGGILQWMIDGCGEWLDCGLNPLKGCYPKPDLGLPRISGCNCAVANGSNCNGRVELDSHRETLRRLLALVPIKPRTVLLPATIHGDPGVKGIPTEAHGEGARVHWNFRCDRCDRFLIEI